MKIAAIFFGSHKRQVLRKDNNLKEIFLNCINYIYFFVFVISFTYIVSKVKIDNNILWFATNIYNFSSEFEIQNIKNIYAVFNDKSYIFEEKNEIQVVEEPKEENTKMLYGIYEITNEEKLLDIIAKDYEYSTFEDLKSSSINVDNRGSFQDIYINGEFKIRNYSSNRGIDYLDLINRNINLTKNDDKVLLYSTHTSETYENSEKYQFGYTGTYRVQDEKYNMISVAKKLKEGLIKHKIQTIHDSTPHDYFAYTGAYMNSRNTIVNNLNTYGRFGVIIDVHRDAIADLSYAPKVNISGVNVAQCMLVMGVRL